MSPVSRLLVATAIAALLATLVSPARAVDGVIEINMTVAETGGVTGDLGADPPGFPVVITQPGSYRLTGPLQIGEVSAIEVFADHVTIDLNGFAIAGPASCSGTPVTGCTPSGGPAAIDAMLDVYSTHTTVRNGVIRGSSGVGANLGRNARLEDVVLEVNAGGGAVLRWEAVVTGVIASRNGGAGITIDSGDVRNVVAVGNALSGIDSAGLSVSLVAETVSAGNGDAGIRTLVGTLEGVVVSANAGKGVAAGYLVTDSVVRGNGDTGLQLDSNAGYGRNVVTGNGGAGNVSGGHAIACNMIGGIRVCPP